MYELLKLEFERTQKTLKDVESSIRRITGRDADQFTLKGNLRFNKTDGGFPQKPNAFNRKRQLNAQFRQNEEKEEEELVDEESPDEDNAPSKKPSLQSTVVATLKDVKSRRATLEEQKSDKRIFARNRRMFGMILGTLQKFQSEESRRKVQVDKRAEIDKKVEEAALKERELIKKEKEQLFLTRREKQMQVRCIEKKMEIAEIHQVWQNSHKYLVNFIRTTAEPQIMYLPKKHNVQTKKALAESQEQISALIKEQNNKVVQELLELENCYKKGDGGEEMEEVGDKENFGEFAEPDSEEQQRNLPSDSSQGQDLGTVSRDSRTVDDISSFVSSENKTQTSTKIDNIEENAETNLEQLADQEDFEPIYDD